MDVPSEAIASRQSMILDLPPSCIEFCLMHPAYFVVGTYNLEKEDAPRDGVEAEEPEAGQTKSKAQSRNGSLIVFHLHNKTISRIRTISQPSAILDLHFCPLPQKQDILAVASSTGTLAIFQLDPKTDESSPLKHLATSRISDMPEGVLILSCAWHPTAPDLIAVTTSAGEVRVIRLDESWSIVENSEDAIITHTLETWTVAFSSPESTAGHDTAGGSREDGTVTIYSGGDDSMLRFASCVAADPKDNEATLQAMYPALQLSGHGAGVTAILPLPVRLTDGSTVVITGSYDDHVRIFAIQSPHETYGAKRARELVQLNLGGGVWRLKLIDIKETNAREWRAWVLASCMHAGARVLEVTGTVDDNNWGVRVLGRFEEHKSMNYGSDFQPELDGGKLVCASTSFYDKLLCLWELGME